MPPFRAAFFLFMLRESGLLVKRLGEFLLEFERTRVSGNDLSVVIDEQRERNPIEIQIRTQPVVILRLEIQACAYNIVFFRPLFRKFFRRYVLVGNIHETQAFVGIFFV